MSAPGFLAQARQHLAVATSLVALVANLGSPLPVAAQDSAKDSTATPILPTAQWRNRLELAVQRHRQFRWDPWPQLFAGQPVRRHRLNRGRL